MSEKGKIVDAFAEWDDRDQTFRVYLVREEPDRDDETSPEEPQPMEAAILDGSVEARLHKAAFVRCWRDFTGDHERVLGFAKRTSAERVAKAVKAELKRIEKGDPGPTDHEVHMTAQLALMLRRKTK